MSASPSGTLTKLVIEAYDSPDCAGTATGSFTVMFNPETYTTKHAVQYEEDDQAQGTTGLPQRYKGTAPTDFSLGFTLDGTGAAVDPVDVDELLYGFLQTVQSYDGEMHRPPYLKIVWGAFLMRCVFKSADIKSTLFRPDGTTLRAEISATFTGFVDDERRVAEERASSPDLTHRHVVREGETLPMICVRYYGGLGPLVHLARFNGLGGMLGLRSGQALYLPPLEGGAR